MIFVGGGTGPPPRICCLLTDAEFGDDRTVPLDIGFLQIVEQAAAMTDHLQKTAAAVMILRVLFEMLVEGVDPVGQDRDLDLGRSGVALMDGILFDDVRLFFLEKSHGFSPLS